MKSFKFLVTLLLLAVIGVSCQKNELLTKPTDNPNNSSNLVSERGSKSDYLLNVKSIQNKLEEYNSLAKELAQPSFQEQYGQVDFENRLTFENEINDNFVFYRIMGKNQAQRFLISAKNTKQEGLFIISNDMILTSENTTNTPIDPAFSGLFASNNSNTGTGTTAGIVRPEPDLPCSVIVMCSGCPSGWGYQPCGGGSSDDSDDHHDDNPPWWSGGDNGGGSVSGPINIDNIIDTFDKIRFLKKTYNLGPKVVSWLFENSSFFLDKEITDFLIQKLAKISDLQGELGFDDEVAVYLLENAEDGCDMDCMLNQIYQGIFINLDVANQSDIDFLKNSPELWGYILNPDNQFDDNIILDIILNYLRNKYEKRNSPYNQTNQCEKDLINSHPISASYLGVNWASANILTKYMVGSNGTNDCSDAYRHALFNALNSVFLGEDLARSFGEAHECESISEMAETMDLHNNEIGYSIIANNPVLKFQLTQTDTPSWAMPDLLSEICTSLAIGELLVFSHPDAPASYPGNILINSNCSCLH